MIKIGQYNKLKVNRHVDFGVYLCDEEGHEVLMPSRYVTDQHADGSEVDVFVYNDSEDRLVATTVHPFATVGEFAFLAVAATNSTGAFLDWGLPKDLLVPFSEQKVKMKQGGIYLVYVYLDHETKRVVASAKVEKFLGNVYPNYQPGDKVKALVWQRTDIGYKAIVDNLHQGLFYLNELTKPLTLEQSVDAYIKCVRPDGKIDLTLAGASRDRTEGVARDIMEALKANGGKIDLGDGSDPALIKQRFDCSKKDFKKALGLLYKQHKVTLTPNSTTLRAGATPDAVQ